jgi:hypothetical protein
MVSRGTSNSIIEFVGGIIILSSFILMAYFAGWKAFFALLLMFWVVITPLVEMLISTLGKRLYGSRVRYSRNMETSTEREKRADLQAAKDLVHMMMETGQIKEKYTDEQIEKQFEESWQKKQSSSQHS